MNKINILFNDLFIISYFYFGILLFEGLDWYENVVQLI